MQKQNETIEIKKTTTYKRDFGGRVTVVERTKDNQKITMRERLEIEKKRFQVVQRKKMNPFSK